MVISHNLGFPRIGVKRDIKWAVEAYWRGETDSKTLQAKGKEIRALNWAMQKHAGVDLIPVNDFSWYDHMLDMSVLLGVIPPRFGSEQHKSVDLDTYFRMARGRAPTGNDVPACEMTKWFDTNYHYIVPEFNPKQTFTLSSDKIFDEVSEAQKLGYQVKPVLVGPLSYLWLGKTKEADFDKLSLLPALIKAYQQILQRLAQQNVTWVQIDEPILVLDLPPAWQQAFSNCYQQLHTSKPSILLATYFGDLGNNLELTCKIPVQGLHIDGVRAAQQIPHIIKQLADDKILSIGIVDGRNIWRTDLQKALETLKPFHKQLGDRLWLAGSCSLLHVPLDLEGEINLDTEMRSWLAFAKQKVEEIALLAKVLNKGEASAKQALAINHTAVTARAQSDRIHNSKVKKKCQAIKPAMMNRKSPYKQRQASQHKILQLPQFPTTTIGSLPQTQEVRMLRKDYKEGKITEAFYEESIKQLITTGIHKQEALGIDVLVHGEFERNDMVEYFGELLEGFAITENGWVQSYGSRCVKPPIIYGDVSRPHPLTVEWSSYAQSLTDKPVKGMLTGPITILCWSFVRNDQSRFDTAKQIALALRDEVSDLEKAGIKVIQIDEPAFREGLPLRRAEWRTYLEQAAQCFRLSASAVEDHTQIHTHMCYSEFNDIIAAIANLDADVITIETSRSNMELLEAFKHFNYPNEIGPGVYDIHSPQVPSIEDITQLIEAAMHSIPIDRLWINPDCGLKTRNWPEVEEALHNMVEAARTLRRRHQNKSQTPTDSGHHVKVSQESSECI